MIKIKDIKLKKILPITTITLILVATSLFSGCTDLQATSADKTGPGILYQDGKYMIDPEIFGDNLVWDGTTLRSIDTTGGGGDGYRSDDSIHSVVEAMTHSSMNFGNNSENDIYTKIVTSNGRIFDPTGRNFQRAIWDLNSSYGGWIRYSGNLTYSDNITINMNNYPKGFVLNMDGSSITYTGSGWALTVNNSRYGCQFKLSGGEWTSALTYDPSGCIRLKDSGNCHIEPNSINYFQNSTDTSCGISVENWYVWSEMNNFVHFEIDRCDICLDFKPSTITGGPTGTVSFDDTYISDLSMHPIEYGIRFRGSFYASHIEGVHCWFAEDNAVAFFLNGTMKNVVFENFKAEDCSNAHSGEIVFETGSGFTNDMYIQGGWISGGDTDLFKEGSATGSVFWLTTYPNDDIFRIWSLTDNTNMTFQSTTGNLGASGRITAEDSSYIDADQLYVDDGNFQYSPSGCYVKSDTGITTYFEGCSDNGWQSMFLSFIRNRGADLDSQAAVQASDRVATFDYKVNNGSSDILIAGYQVSVNSTATINATPPGYQYWFVKDNTGDTKYLKMYPHKLYTNLDFHTTGKLTSDGGNDPPYVLYNKENLSSIIERINREVPNDEDHKWDGQAIFYNSEIDNMMLINPESGDTREFVWKSDFDALEQRIAYLETLVESLI